MSGLTPIVGPFPPLLKLLTGSRRGNFRPDGAYTSTRIPFNHSFVRFFPLPGSSRDFGLALLLPRMLEVVGFERFRR